MTEQEFPEVFTYTVSAEIEANADGYPEKVSVLNAGNMGVAIARHIAVEAMASWQGKYSLDYTLRVETQSYSTERKTEVITFSVENH